jgi:imidazolonepropionase-like amidohydrolase
MRLSTCILGLRFFILVLAFSLVVALNATAATKAVKFGNLWDGHGKITNAVVIVENDKIQSVAATGTIPAGAEVIDLSRYTGIPGMIDSHTHLTYYWDPGLAPIQGASRPGMPR